MHHSFQQQTTLCLALEFFTSLRSHRHSQQGMYCGLVATNLLRTLPQTLNNSPSITYTSIGNLNKQRPGARSASHMNDRFLTSATLVTTRRDQDNATYALRNLQLEFQIFSRSLFQTSRVRQCFATMPPSTSDRHPRLPRSQQACNIKLHSQRKEKVV